MKKTKVAFVCVHNSCRSQIAEALTKKFARDSIEVYSAGTELKDQINQDAVRLVKEMYAIDMEESQKPKLLDDIPKVCHHEGLLLSIQRQLVFLKYDLISC